MELHLLCFIVVNNAMFKSSYALSKLALIQECGMETGEKVIVKGKNGLRWKYK